jgi:hypothetical protein
MFLGLSQKKAFTPRPSPLGANVLEVPLGYWSIWAKGLEGSSGRWAGKIPPGGGGVHHTRDVGLCNRKPFSQISVAATVVDTAKIFPWKSQGSRIIKPEEQFRGKSRNLGK